MSIKLKARTISPGYGEGEALICTDPLGFNHGVIIETGVIKEHGHQLEGVSIKDKVLIFPHGHGSTGGSYVVYQLARAGTGPRAVINLNTENIIAVGAIMGGLPVVDHLEDDPFSRIRNGDWVKVDADNGLVEIVAKGDPGYPAGPAAAVSRPPSAVRQPSGGLRLTDEEKALRDGREGEAVATAMNMLISLGEIYGAEKMVPVQSAHIAGLSLKSHGLAGMLWAEEMAAKGARVRVPTSGNVIGVDRSRDLKMPPEWVEPQMRIEKAYEKMGMLGLSTCTPYFCGLAPKFGDIVAWAESSAVVYVNSILGARDNREGGPSALAAALTGRTPYCGLHLDANRRGDLLIKLKTKVETFEDYGALGNYVGRQVGEKIPVFENLGRPPQEILVAFGAALASAGGVALFHALGLTPEAVTLDAAFGGKKYEILEVGAQEIADGYDHLNSASGREVDFVALGCPHATINQIQEIAARLQGRKISGRVMMWVQTNLATKALAREAGFAQTIEAAGAVLTQDLCTVLAVPEALGATVVATNSPKLAFYGPGANGLGVKYGSLENCVEAALTGLWPPVRQG